MPNMSLDEDTKRRDSRRDDAHLEDLSSLSPELDQELRKLEHIFTVDAAKLKEITLQFEHELRQGLSRVSRCLLPSLEPEGGNLPMLPTWVLGFPSGHECGEYLTIDLGGTKLRICWVTLNQGKGENHSESEIYHIPKDYKVGTADQLWSFLAESMEDFMTKRHIEPEEGTVIPLGFTFSYPATQEYIDQGVLQTWTKGFDIKGVEGHDVADQLRQALHKRGLPIQIVALINDTVGAMIASAYTDPETIIGAIFGTGCNASYMENCGSIAKLGGLPQDLPMAINCEYGAFDNDRCVLPRTIYDKKIDKESPRPGEQTFEKMSAGMYIGEIFRQVLVDFHKKGLLFMGQDTSKLCKPYLIKTGFLVDIADDATPKLQHTQDDFYQLLGINLTASERIFCRRAGQLIATRGARLSACGIAAICRKKNMTSGHVAADQVVANNPRFKAQWARALGEIFNWPKDRRQDPIIMTTAADGSGLGAAVISAMTLQRVARGDTTGLRPE